MTLVSRACDLLWSCFAWSSDDENERIVHDESVPPIQAMGVPQTDVVGSDVAAPSYEDRINTMEEAIRRLSAENQALRTKQLETNVTVRTLRNNLENATKRIDRHGSQIASVNAQMWYSEPRDFVAYDSGQSSSGSQQQRSSIEATYSPSYRVEEEEVLPNFSS